VELKATRFEVDGHVATVWLDRPHRRNAWTGRMHVEYRWILGQLADDDAVRVVIVSGTPPAFCVGADAEALAGHADAGRYDDGLERAGGTRGPFGHGVPPELDHDFAFQWGLPYVTIAAVNGACAGVGLALALFCDLRFVSATAKLTTAAPRLGLPAEYGMSWVLPRLVGTTRAADLLLSGRVVTGAETAEWGCWNDVLPTGAEVLVAATACARHLATGVGPAALRTTKRQLYEDLRTHDVGAALTRAGELLAAAMTTDEYGEGIAAFRAARPPKF
jgi:enoyl-CoA hydratase/carnithine racemase